MFYVDHMALIYLVNKPKVLRKITRWLILFLKHDFIVVYKPCNNNVVVNVLCKLPDVIEASRVP
jgi:hypothetical protein